MALSITYPVLRREVGRMLGMNRDPAEWSANEVQDVEDIINSGLRRFYTPAPLQGERYGHVWSFLSPKASMTTTAPFSTGTVTIAAGVVTSATGHWPASAADGELVISGVSYTVASRDGDHQITLDDTSVTAAAGTTFALNFPTYDLPSTFAMFDGPLTYAPGAGTLYPAIEITSEHTIRQRQQESVSTGRPTVAAIRPKTLVATTGSRFEIIFDPTPDDAYTLYYRYKVDPGSLDATNCYPYGGDSHAETILESCLAAAEAKMNDGAGIHMQLFQERLAASVSHDRRLAAPDRLGVNRDFSDELPEDWRDRQENIVYYNAVAY